jgi:hypothetical protein
MPEGEWDEYVDDIQDLLEADEVFDASEVTWFSAAEGLKTVLALIAEIDKTPEFISRARSGH